MSERPQTRARKRLGRCYALAGKSLHAMKDPGGWRLAHGEVDCYDPASDSPRMGHAWLETRDEVFDPVANEYFSKDDYYSLGYPTNVRRSKRRLNGYRPKEFGGRFLPAGTGISKDLGRWLAPLRPAGQR